MSFPWRTFACGMGVLILTGPGAAARAQTISYSGTTIGQPTWRRPLDNGNSTPTVLSPLNTAVRYSAFTFTPSTSGLFGFLSVTTNPAGWDNTLFLYQNAFNAVSPLTNVLIGNDDLGPSGQSDRAGFNFNLSAGTPYIVVTSGYANADAGAFQNSIQPVQAATYSGTTANGPLWERPDEGAPPTTLSGETVRYSVQAFSVSQAGSYSLLSLAAGDWDNYTFLYTSSFNAAAPLANALTGNDDFSGLVGQSAFAVNLSANTQYYIVTTGYDSAALGAFTNTITGPGTVRFGSLAAAPEPGSIALLIVGGLAFTGIVRRRVVRSR